jgi:hypothetical protein
MTDNIMEIENKYWKDQKEALDRLENNKDFKAVILDGYLREFAINQTSMLATDYVRKTGTRGEVMERLVSISNLQDYFITIHNMVGSPDDEDETETSAE